MGEPLWFWLFFALTVLLLAGSFGIYLWENHQDRLDAEDHEAWARYMRGER